MTWVTRISKISRTRSGPWPWAIALLCFAASLATRILLDPLLYGLKFLTFYPAICIATLVGGWPHGLLVLILSALSAWYFFSEPINSFAIKDATTIAALVGFLFVGGFTVLLVAALREVVSRLEQANLMQEVLFRELQHRVANNLQTVGALLRDARRSLREPSAAAEKLDKAEGRGWAMSQLHRQLHDGTALAAGLEPLLRQLLADVFDSLPVDVRLSVTGASDLSLDQITAMTLLVNEAALNSAKHVFSEGRGTSFSVFLKQENDPGRWPRHTG